MIIQDILIYFNIINGYFSPKKKKKAMDISYIFLLLTNTIDVFKILKKIQSLIFIFIIILIRQNIVHFHKSQCTNSFKKSNLQNLVLIHCNIQTHQLFM